MFEVIHILCCKVSYCALEAYIKFMYMSICLNFLERPDHFFIQMHVDLYEQ